ncbi:hypothetical protein H8S90_03830 [Olivibacter sp. SDN3]|uniref:RNA polymerase sigma factor n=1 Tax=Olivibacter sp. SDN3 TaxID=2764720 RepID=UPI0016514592|nr:hypothetical protein [Olivibacter sp. SDN3]QNL50739.1 hypothetical protein H8S90_03830 [Olivibacter sp. SDN3]
MKRKIEWDGHPIWNDSIIKGQQHVFSALMMLYTDTLHIYSMRLCQDEELVKDCFQEVFLFLWGRKEYLNEPACLKFI